MMEASKGIETPEHEYERKVYYKDSNETRYYDYSNVDVKYWPEHLRDRIKLKLVN